jgi:hypothetical protein
LKGHRIFENLLPLGEHEFAAQQTVCNALDFVLLMYPAWARIRNTDDRKRFLVDSFHTGMSGSRPRQSSRYRASPLFHQRWGQSQASRADQGRGTPFAYQVDSRIHAVGRGTFANSLSRRR